jgi:hypothetical protein
VEERRGRRQNKKIKKKKKKKKTVSVYCALCFFVCRCCGALCVESEEYNLPAGEKLA